MTNKEQAADIMNKNIYDPLLSHADNRINDILAGLEAGQLSEGREKKWRKASEQLPGIFKVVKWRNGDGGNIPLGENTFLDQYSKVGPNTSWHEWLDESTEELSERRGLRPVTVWFADQMEMKLKANDHKAGWSNDTVDFLIKRLKEETKELVELFGWRQVDNGRSVGEGLLVKDVSNEAIVKECVDIANFAMMIADNYGKEIGNKKQNESIPVQSET